jgi:FkbM family methyltransferase
MYFVTNSRCLRFGCWGEGPVCSSFNQIHIMTISPSALPGDKTAISRYVDILDPSVARRHGAANERNINGSVDKPALVLVGRDDALTVGVATPFLGVWFYRHRWSGIAEVVVGEHSYLLDLYADQEAPWLFEVPVPIAAKAVHVTIKATGEKNARASAGEIWVQSVYCATSPVAMEPGLSRREVSLTPQITCVHGREGHFLVLSKDVGISKTIRDEGVWAEKDVQFFKRILKPGMRVIDVGANLGHHTVVFSKLIGEGGQVLSCEPQSLIFQLLQANIALNGCKNVVAQQVAVGVSSGSLKLWPIDYDQPGNVGALGVSQQEGHAVRNHGGEDIEMLVTDDFVLKHFGAKKVDFVKIDVQSYELYVLQGAKELLAKHKPDLFLEISPYFMRHTGYDYREIYALLASYGYKVFEPHLSLSRPAGVREWSGDQLEEWDIYATVRPISRVRE